MRFAAGIALLVVNGGCDSPGDPMPPIAITLTESELTVTPGIIGPGPYRFRGVFVRFTVHRNGYDGPLTLSVEAPSPLITPAPLTTSGTAAFPPWVEIEVPSGTPGGSHVVTLRATAGTRGSVQASLTLVVKPLAMWLGQSTVKVNQGGMNTVSLFFNKDPSVAVNVSVSSPSAGVSIAPTPPTPGDVSFLDIGAAPDATVGTQTVTVTASGSGITVSRPLQIVVQGPPPKRAIAFRSCRDQYVLPPFYGPYRGSFAYANDGEAWKSVAPDQDDVIRFEATERVSFANTFDYTVSLYTGGPVTRVIHATAAELEEMQCASASPGPEKFTISTSNADSYQVTFGSFRASTVNKSGYGGTRSGPHDLVAIGDRTTPTGRQNVAIVRSGVDLANGETIALDFAGPEAVVLDSATQAFVPITPTPGPINGTVASRIHTSTTIALIRASGSGWYWAIPESRLQPGDVQSVLFAESNYVVGTAKGAVYYFRSPVALTSTFGPDLPSPTVDRATQTITLASQAEYPDLAGVGYRRVIDLRGTAYDVEVWQTRGFVGQTPQTWTFNAPDLGRVVSVPRIESDHASAGAASGALLFFGGAPPSGSELRWALRQGGRFAMLLPFPAGR